jgi:hypothetical protein
MKISRFILGISALAALSAGIAFAATSAGGIGGISDAAHTLYCALIQVLPIVSMLMIIAGGCTYAAGQIMGAETRARASQWATAMLIGAVIGILIVTVAPTVLDAMYGGPGKISNVTCP